MPKRNDIEKVLVIGSGPFIIGQNSEYDYFACQTLRALRELGIETVYVNSNPSTVSTDKELADATYIEPLDVKHLASIIARENPSAVLPVFGGQKALNLVSELSRAGILEQYDVKIIGLTSDDILKTENREVFKKMILGLGLEMAESSSASTVEEAESICKYLGFPLVIRPAFTIGGFGGGLVYNIEELREVASRGISASLVRNILVERAVVGWKELEVEALRDKSGKVVIAGIVENVDTMGVHTGDSMTITPPETVASDTIDKINEAVKKIAKSLSVQGCFNVQFAYDPKSNKLIIIEVNLRTTRTTTLISKVYGLNIADISTRLAMGIEFKEIKVSDKSLDKYTPKCNYKAIKMPRWSIDKFRGAEDNIHTQMKSYGEVVAFGYSFIEAFVKAIESSENGSMVKSYKDIETCLMTPSSERYYQIINALFKGVSVEEVSNLTSIDIYYIKEISKLAKVIIKMSDTKSIFEEAELFKLAKSYGLSDSLISSVSRTAEKDIRDYKKIKGIMPSVGNINNDSGYFLSYNKKDNKVNKSKKEILIIGNGPNRIGQGAEFDYLVTKAAQSVKEQGYEPIIVNNNLAGVSTSKDYKVYFVPINLENIISVYEYEQPEGVILGFGGHTPYSMVGQLEENGISILDIESSKVNLTQDITQYSLVLNRLGITTPKFGIANDIEQAIKVASEINYPIIARPSYVIGGKGNTIIHKRSELEDFMSQLPLGERVTIEEFLTDAKEYEVDAVCAGNEVYIPQVMEHIEYAGIHSGDSDCLIPPLKDFQSIIDASTQIAKELNVNGLINIKYAMVDNKLYLLETRLRASRTVALMSKATGVNLVGLSVSAILNKGAKQLLREQKRALMDYYVVKAAVFPFEVFRETDPKLGPEMKSTGSVLGIASTFGEAYYKAQIAAYSEIPLNGKVLISVDDSKKKYLVPVAREFINLGYTIIATGGTYDYLLGKGIKSDKVYKMNEGRPNIADAMINGEVNLLVNTPSGIKSEYDDSFIRKVAIRQNICYITTIEAAQAAINGIKEAKSKCSVKALQRLYK